MHAEAAAAAAAASVPEGPPPPHDDVSAPSSPWLSQDRRGAAHRGLDSAAVYEARLRCGMNELRTAVVPLHHVIARGLLSPNAALVAGAALVANVAGRHRRLWCAAAFVGVLQVAVPLTAALVSRARVRCLQRCLAHGSAVAYRDESWVLTGAEQLVPGDLVQLVAGSAVLADCTVGSGSAALVDMAEVTGRTRVEAATGGQLLVAGARVVDGAGDAVVCHTGADTFAGRAVEQLERLSHGFTQRLELSRAFVGTVALTVAATVTAAVVTVGALQGWDGYPASTMAVEVPLLALLCAPLCLDVAVYATVSRGAAAAMQRAQAVVLRPSALLSLAAVDTLLVDKTGTLSSGHCELAEPHCAYLAAYPTRAAVMQLMALACQWRQPSLRPTTRAVLRSVDLDACDEYTQLTYAEHESEHRRTAVLRHRSGTVLRVTHGRLRSVVALAKSSESAAACVEAQRRAFSWHQRGLRCVAVAVADVDGPWRLAGVLTFACPLRDDAAPLVADCSRLGVAVTLVSGDEYRAVAAAAEAVQLRTSIVTGRDVPPLRVQQQQHEYGSAGAELDVVADMEATAMAAEEYVACRAYAEMAPEDKAALVRVLQQHGRVVAVMGDGINDAAAAHVADVGIALVSADRDRTAAWGALWGADVALTSDSVGAAVELLVGGRELFGAVVAVVAWTLATALQMSVLTAALAVAVPRRCTSAVTGDGELGLAPSRLHTVTLLCASCATLLWMSTLAGDSAYWITEPCRVCRATMVLQTSAIALVGAAGGVALGVLGGFACDAPQSWSASGAAPLPRLTVERLGGLVTLYVLHVNLLLTLTCASPARAGWRVAGLSRLRCVLALAVAYTLVTCWVVDVELLVAAGVGVYAGAVAVLQDGAKLLVYRICLCLGLPGHRQHRHGRAASAAGVETTAAAEEERAAVAALQQQQQEQEQRNAVVSCGASAAPRHPASAALDAMAGCIGGLDVRLLCRVPPASTPSAAAA
ncbi:proton motive ATPase [Novymonas esmeraldas]|uniref:Proton motive ATPase n=1 Tax=Novymonas esmeraldas TaxID=1808958 RepID=A0AAW0F9M1_9TRYP